MNTEQEFGIQVRSLTRTPEFDACVQLQRHVWGFDDTDLVPVRMFVVANKIGGLVLGAYDADNLVGYALALPGVRNNHAYLHSHMLAVAPEFRDRGIGRMLKLRQRELALRRGIELIEWTFDPLEAKNCYFNLEVLGAISRRYLPNLYGANTSALQAGLPSDRLVAEWWLRSNRVERALQPPSGADSAAPVSSGAPPVTLAPGIQQWKSERNPRALQMQAALRTQLEAAFAHGWSILGFERIATGGGRFRMGRFDEPWSYGFAAEAEEL